MTARRVPEIEGLFGRPGAVAAVEWWGPGDPEALSPGERALVVDAVPGRRAQFAAGRHCAAAALAALGRTPRPLGRRADGRSPDWPPDVRGSLSHTEDYAVAVVAERSGSPSPGVDAEQPGRVRPDLYRRLFTSGEQRWLAERFGADQAVEGEVATALFGLKECYYKAQFPLTGAWVGFHDVEIGPGGPAPSTGAADGPEVEAGAPGRWRLDPATDLPALAAVNWPVRGWSLTRRHPGMGREVVVTVVAADPVGSAG